MTIRASDLTCTPNQDAIERLAEAWAWLLKEPFRPVLFSIMGDVFFEPDSGGIWWLNTGTGELTRVADSVDSFEELWAPMSRMSGSCPRSSSTCTRREKFPNPASATRT